MVRDDTALVFDNGTEGHQGGCFSQEIHASDLDTDNPIEAVHAGRGVVIALVMGAVVGRQGAARHAQPDLVVQGRVVRGVKRFPRDDAPDNL